MPLTTQELRNKAADYLKKNGWTQRVCSIGRSRCMAFALEKSTKDTFLVQAAYKEMGFMGCGDVIRWNDYNGRTKKEVIAKLRGSAT